MKFNEAINKLEEIIRKLEEGADDLDVVVKLFEEGSELIKYCNKSLTEVEAKIEIISRKINQSDKTKSGDELTESAQKELF